MIIAVVDFKTTLVYIVAAYTRARPAIIASTAKRALVIRAGSVRVAVVRVQRALVVVAARHARARPARIAGAAK